jgi:parvulin-like peptidyl-prolyl isomerase
MVFLREILIPTEGKDDSGVAAAEKKARELSARARRGEKFHEMARQHSDSGSKNQFGEIGGYARGQLDKIIEDIVSVQQRGFVSDPIRIANGFLILRIEEKHKPGLASFEGVENEIAGKLYTNRFQSEIRAYLTKLRREAFLEIKGDYSDSGAAPGKNTAWADRAQLKPETVTKEQLVVPRRRRLLWTIPIPGTETYKKTPVSKSN